MKGHNLKLTSDGSHSVFSEKFQALYHSKHGAIQESKHVFIKSGLHYLKSSKTSIKILEMGFGTGLNVLLTYIESESIPNIEISIDSVEAYPIDIDDANKLNYLSILGRNDLSSLFHSFHKMEWDIVKQFSPNFMFRKVLNKIEEVDFDKKYDLVYYDAFAPLTQSELWTEEIFNKISEFLNKGAILVSYCSKGSFKRALISAGFSTEKIPGPPGKREMIRATYLG